MMRHFALATPSYLEWHEAHSNAYIIRTISYIYASRGQDGKAICLWISITTSRVGLQFNGNILQKVDVHQECGVEANVGALFNYTR